MALELTREGGERVAEVFEEDDSGVRTFTIFGEQAVPVSVKPSSSFLPTQISIFFLSMLMKFSANPGTSRVQLNCRTLPMRNSSKWH
jgi:hypothetical protein